jgi:threonine dehydrogenase-like Zn-dependent dehydrogenase
VKAQAVFFIAPGQAELREIECDDSPLGPQEVAGPTVASVISPGTELAVYGGLLPGATFPSQTGYAAVFRVAEMGSEVTGLQVDDLALCMGPHQSWQRSPAGGVLRVPGGLSAEQAGFARLANIGLTALTTTTARPPEQVAVTGLGLVGNLAAQVFQLCGYEVIACDPMEGRRTLAQIAGLRCVMERVPLDDPALAGQVDLVVECSGHEQAALEACRMVRKRGEMVLAGVPWKRYTDLSAHELLSAVFHGYVVLRSGWEWEVPYHPTDFRQGSLVAQMAGALKWLAEGRLKVDGLYDQAPADQAADVYGRLSRRENERLTCVFNWSGEGRA